MTGSMLGVRPVEVAIVVRTLDGVESFYAQCLECEWRCHPVPHGDGSTARDCAAGHGVVCPGHPVPWPGQFGSGV